MFGKNSNPVFQTLENQMHLAPTGVKMVRKGSSMTDSIWRQETGEGPLVAVALHDGHEVRADLSEAMLVSPGGRRREEDPCTGEWAEVAPTRLIGTRSRFEVDLNRAREEAVYLTPEDAWGIQVWKQPLREGQVKRSLDEYDLFYRELKTLLAGIERKHGAFFVFDLHNYNHRREGPDGPPADPEGNPEVNIGTGTLDRAFWAPVVERFIKDLRAFDFLGRQLDVRENVKFVGRGFPRFVHTHFPKTGCAIAIEFKKFFMDECTGAVDPLQHEAIKAALRSTVHGVLDGLEEVRQA